VLGTGTDHGKLNTVADQSRTEAEKSDHGTDETAA
jgi:hypothetical protein